MRNTNHPEDLAEIARRAPHEYIEELASIVLGRGKGLRTMAFYRAYVDVSGAVDQGPFLVMAGYVASADQWGGLVDQWAAILQREHISVWHMADFNARRGEYRGWSTERGEQVYAQLSEVITTHVSVGIVTAVEVEVYREIVVGQELGRLYGENPYQYCVYNCIIHVSDWARENGLSQRIAYILECGDKGQKKVMKTLLRVFSDAGLCERWQLGTLALVQKKTPEAIPCQPADMLAWEFRWELAEQRAPSPRDPRPSLGRLLLPSARTVVWARDSIPPLMAPFRDA